MEYCSLRRSQFYSSSSYLSLKSPSMSKEKKTLLTKEVYPDKELNSKASRKRTFKTGY